MTAAKSFIELIPSDGKFLAGTGQGWAGLPMALVEDLAGAGVSPIESSIHVGEGVVNRQGRQLFPGIKLL